MSRECGGSGDSKHPDLPAVCPDVGPRRVLSRLFWTQDRWADWAWADSGSGQQPGSRCCKTGLVCTPYGDLLGPRGQSDFLQRQPQRQPRCAHGGQPHGPGGGSQAGPSAGAGWRLLLPTAGLCGLPGPGLLPWPPPRWAGRGAHPGRTDRGLRAGGGESALPGVSLGTWMLGSPRWRQALLAWPGQAAPSCGPRGRNAQD